MPIAMNRAPGVEITLLSRSFIVRRLAVGVPQSTSTSIFCAPKVSCVRLTSYFWGLTLHTIRAWATSFHRSDDMLLRSMKCIVLVPVFLPVVPWANRPILLPNENPSLFCTLGVGLGDGIREVCLCHRRLQRLQSLPGTGVGSVVVQIAALLGSCRMLWWLRRVVAILIVYFGTACHLV